MIFQKLFLLQILKVQVLLVRQLQGAELAMNLMKEILAQIPLQVK